MTSPKPRRHVRSRCWTAWTFLRNDSSTTGRRCCIVAADHPSLIDARERFAAELRAEQRYFGGRARTAETVPVVDRHAGVRRRIAPGGHGRRPDHRSGRASAPTARRRSPWSSDGADTAWRARCSGSDRAGPTRRALDGLHPLEPRSRAVAAIGESLGRHVVDLGRADRADLHVGPTLERAEHDFTIRLRSQLLLIQ